MTPPSGQRGRMHMRVSAPARELAGVLAAAGIVVAAGASPTAALADPPVLAVKPSQLDRSIREFDDSHVIMPAKRADAPLAVFLVGTSGRPQGMMRLLNTIREQGYAVIGLEYRDAPAINAICPTSDDPDCHGSFRRMRLHG